MVIWRKKWKRLPEKPNQMSGFRQKIFYHAFYLHTYSIYSDRSSYCWDALHHTEALTVKTKVDCFMAHKNISHTQKHKGLNDLHSLVVSFSIRSMRFKCLQKSYHFKYCKYRSSY